MPFLLLAGLFLVTAILYAAVGFGGGSTYNALLVLNGTDYRILPAIALACNIVVVSGGVWRFSRSGDLDARRLLPFLIASVPAAWLGGGLPVSETVFIGLLGAALLLSGLRMVMPSKALIAERSLQPSKAVALATGASIGFLSGIVGIGGGIFLAPVLYALRWDSPRKIAAACSLFILVNSVSGLGGQMSKLSRGEFLDLALPYWPLLLAVLIGGQAGSLLAAKHIRAVYIKRLTAVLILYVAARLLWRLFGMV